VALDGTLYLLSNSTFDARAALVWRPQTFQYYAFVAGALLSVLGLWARVFHVCFPATAAAHIGWQMSPFQFRLVWLIWRSG
jgi:hypothetical protein